MAGRGQETIQNPCTKWFKWAGSTGKVSFYDKLTQENVEVQLPFTFLLLDVLATIKGFDESTKHSIWSNEVRNTKESKMVVKSGSDIIAQGMYSDIKEKVVSSGGGYAASCYIAFKDENGELVIGNMTMTGSSLGGGVHKPSDKNMKDIEVGAWIEFTKSAKNDLYKKAIQIIGKDDRICTQGNVKFYCPKFSLIATTPETDKAAIELNNELQAYLETYLKVETKQDAQLSREIAADSVEKEAEIFPSKEKQFESNSQDKPFVNAPKIEAPTAGIADDEDLPF